jgi:Ca2+-transporting ATPase
MFRKSRQAITEQLQPGPGGKAWYQMSAAEVAEALSTSEAGLTSAEAKARLAKYGYNEIKFKKRSALVRFLLQFRNALVYLLLASALVTAILQHWTDTAVILVVVIANAIIGFVQEGKAEASMEALTGMLVPECTVLRDGEVRQIPARELVPGDVVILDEGAVVPADLRLFYAKNLSTDEAALTGESVPVEKETEPQHKADLSPADQHSMAFSGTFAVRGAGKGIAVATAEKTELGKIAMLMKGSHTDTQAPLMRKVGKFTKFIIIAVLVLASINLILGATLGDYSLVDAFMASVALAVAAIPEGLPAILTIALAFGAKAMAGRNALIRRLPAVETLGSATVICSDKTGTLTRNEMTVVRVCCGEKTYQVTGAGYAPQGEFLRDGQPVEAVQETDLLSILTAGLLCNNAILRENAGVWEMLGDPTEGALVVSARKAGLVNESARLDEVPFESHLQYMATLHRDTLDNVIYVKGAPEKLLGMCTGEIVDGAISPLETGHVLAAADSMAADALRVLGLAVKRVPSHKTTLSFDDLRDMAFLGLQGMIDPPRQEAIESVAKCKRAGIRVAMITGDHATTAAAIAAQLGISENGRVLTGEEISRMTDDELGEVVNDVSVYARVSPEHKYKIAAQLQRRGHIVAMTGDGVNDAPALKVADLGIAMGIKGTDVTKEASDMILVDDNFATIVAAVEEGRHVFNNIRKVILYTLPTNGGQAFLILAAIVLAPVLAVFAARLPLTPVQILWINLYDAIALALPLLWEPREKGLLDRPPTDPKKPIADAVFFRKVGLVSVVMAAAAFFIFYHFGAASVNGGAVIDETRLTQAQTAAFMTVMMVHVFYLITARSLTRSVFAMNPFSNRWLIVGISATIGLHLLIVYVLPLVNINPLRVEAFPGSWWLIIIAVSLPAVFIIEIEKLTVRLFKKTV